MQFPGLKPDDIYLPARGVDLRRWAVVACDQYTSQPDYWQRVEAYVGEAPSTLHLVQPEIDLAHAEARIPAIHRAMREYLSNGTLVRAVHDGFTLTERATASGVRLGLVAAVDLEAYDFTPGSGAMIRATEGTIRERIPPRMRIREGAPLECPHVMLLLDDPAFTVIEPLYARLRETAPLCDFELMENGGHLRVWGVQDDDALTPVSNALSALWEKADGLLYAVGDGNHSLATAKACWDALKTTLSPEARQTHPARYALAEIVNLHSPALTFEPIHRVLFGTDVHDLLQSYQQFLSARGMSLTPAASPSDVPSGKQPPAAAQPSSAIREKQAPSASPSPAICEKQSSTDSLPSFATCEKQSLAAAYSSFATCEKSATAASPSSTICEKQSSANSLSAVISEPHPTSADALSAVVSEPPPASADAFSAVINEPLPASADAFSAVINEPLPASANALSAVVSEPRPASADASSAVVSEPHPASANALSAVVSEPHLASADAFSAVVSETHSASADAFSAVVSETHPAPVTVPSRASELDSSAVTRPGVASEARDAKPTDGNHLTFISADACIDVRVENPSSPLPVAVLQPFLDDYLRTHPAARIDYVHGASAVRALCQSPHTTGILLPAIDKAALFPAVRQGGVLPRKTFSMGEADEKRYYMECRKIL